eukprot:gene24544-30904_t
MEVAKAASQKAREVAHTDRPVVFLNIGEPDFTAPPRVKAAAQAVVASGQTQYTPALGMDALRQAISGWYAQRFGVQVPASRIVVTAGASAALQLACLALIDRGDEILMPDPSYPCNRHFVSAAEGTAVLLPTTAEERFQLSAAKVAAAWGPNTRGVLLASPSNPTGTSIDPAELARILDVVRSHGGITLIDEIYLGLIPTTIGGLLSAIGVAGMSRMMQANVIATSGRAVEAAGDVDVLMLDKTGTITLGNRQASAFVPAPGVSEQQLADVAQLASLADETPEGRSIVVLAKQKFNIRERDMASLQAAFVPFTAQTRMSGVDLPGREVRKGAADSVKKYVEALGQHYPDEVARAVDDVSRRGSTPLVVADGGRVMGVVELKDIVKGGIKERFAELRRMGIKTVMITGDNKLTAAAIAAEAGVDDFLAEATPEDKLKLIRSYQAEGRLVAMTGDGTNDAPALAQADVAVAMNSGTQAAKEAGNMVDLDSNPTKLLEIVEIGKQMLMTRGSLTTFSISNDIAKYFAIIPAAFVGTYPQLKALDVMHLASPSSAIMSAVIFNALIIIALIPLALKGVQYRAIGATALLRRNLLVYGAGGIVLPFIGIKLIDMLLAAFNLV